MPQSRLTLLVAGLLGLILCLRLVVYEVNESQVAVLLTFGRATGGRSEPGLGLKWPWPIQQVRRYDARLRVLRGPFEQCSTRDQWPILAAGFLLWRINDPQAFLEAAGEPEAVEAQLRTLLRDAQLAALAGVDFGALVSADPQQLRFEEVERAMQQRVTSQVAQGRLGIEVAMVGIRRLGLPKDGTAAVFERMKEERLARSARILAEGRAEAGRIRAEAEEKRQRELARARAEAQEIMGEAERQAAQSFAGLEDDRQLYVFLQELKALRKLLDQRTTLVFDPSQPPFDLLRRALDRAKTGGTGDAPR